MSGWGETWQERKRLRSIDYWRRHGVGTETCTACSGSGCYDSHGSPACGACGGTGRTRLKLNSDESSLRSIAALKDKRDQERKQHRAELPYRIRSEAGDLQ